MTKLQTIKYIQRNLPQEISVGDVHFIFCRIFDKVTFIFF